MPKIKNGNSRYVLWRVKTRTFHKLNDEIDDFVFKHVFDVRVRNQKADVVVLCGDREIQHQLQNRTKIEFVRIIFFFLKKK